MTVHVELRGVRKTYGDVVAVDDLSLDVKKGECLSLLGPSGCGKTTTLNLIAGFVRPDRGTISIGGSSVERKPPHKRNAGMVFQSYALFPHMIVFENVAFGLRMRHVPKETIPTRVHAALNLVRLRGLERRYPRELSGGQQQRIALARALVIEPTVLLLDEPLSSLDAKLRAQMRVELVQILRDVGITSIFVTHDQEEALAIADRIVVMSDGRIKESGAPEQMYRTPTTSFGAGFLGASNLLSATVASSDGGYLQMIDTGGNQLCAKTDRSWKVGEKVLVMIRPEQFSLVRQSHGGANSIEAQLKAVLFLGPVVRHSLQAPAAGDLTVSVPTTGRSERFDVGDRLFVEWDADQCVVLPVDS